MQIISYVVLIIVIWILKFAYLLFYSFKYDLGYIDCVNAEVCRIELLDPDLLHRRNMYLNYDGELFPITTNIVDIR